MSRLPRWLVARRLVQVGLLAAFAWAAHAGAGHLLRGNLSASVLFDTVPLADPFAALQMLAAGHVLATTALVGAAVVLVFYALIAGRAFCGWVCPVNLVTDAAAWLRRRLGLHGLVRLPRTTRFVVLGLALALSAALGVAAFEWVSPVGLAQRAVIFGLPAAWSVVAGVFLLDLLVLERGVCGHLCPLGAFYVAAGARPMVRVAYHDDRCTACMACHKVCPERQVLAPLLDPTARPDFVAGGACLNCGRCVDVCADDALTFTLRPPGARPARLPLAASRRHSP